MIEIELPGARSKWPLLAATEAYGDPADWEKDRSRSGKTPLLGLGGLVGFDDMEVPGLGVLIEGKGERLQHPKGFKLMKYVCRTADGRAEVEWVWNSRNAVAPFMISHRTGAAALLHADWESDPYLPLHVPNIGDRVIVNLTMEKARKRWGEYVEREWDPGSCTMADEYESKEAAIEYLAKNDFERFGNQTPDVVVVDAELRAYFLRRATALISHGVEIPATPRHGSPEPGRA